MNALTSHLLVSVLILFLAERILHIIKVDNELKKRWEKVLLVLIFIYVFLGLFFKIP